MKKLLAFVLVLFGLLSFTTNAHAATKPQMAGLTFTSDTGDTLDFYDDYVVYHAPGADYSRRGDYSFHGLSGDNWGDVTWKFTVSIYVGSQTITWKGTVKATQGGKVIKLVLNGEEWTR